ncbi:MAG: hypothetical protein WC779_08100 [Candidatus Omnitrophota bacterium]|jgi:F-type H+-transporting ATPase subunit epsilon
MKVKIITAQKKMFEDEASEVILPGEDGEFSVLDDHQACLYSLRSGQIKILFRGTVKQNEKAFTIRVGLAKIANNQLTIMAETF